MARLAGLSLFQRLILAFCMVLVAAFAVSAVMTALADGRVPRELVDQAVVAQAGDVLLDVDG